MSIAVGINSDDFNLSSNVNLAYVKVTKGAGTYNHKVLLELTYNNVNSGNATNNTKTISFASDLNGNDTAIFELSELYKSIVTPMIASDRPIDTELVAVPNSLGSIHTLPNTNTAFSLMFSWSILSVEGFSSFRGNANVMTLKFYEMNSTSATGTPVKIPSTEVEKTIYMLYGRANESDPIQISWSDYKLTDNTKKLLSSNYNEVNGEQHIDIGLNDFHTISFLNICNVNLNAFPEKATFTYYNGSTNLGELEILNQSSSGGAYNSDGTTAGLQKECFLLHMGAGLENLQRIDTNETAYTGTKPDDVSGGRSAITHYTLQISNTGNPDQLRSRIYKFNIKDYCNRYEQNRLSFMNRFGVWEYITLNKEKTSELKIEKNYMQMNPLQDIHAGFGQIGGGYLNQSYSPTLAKQGKRATSVSYDETFTLHTDYLEEYEIDMIQDLMMSPQIHLLDGENAKALILETSTMKLKSEKETGLFKYELKFSFALPKYKSILG